MIQLKKFKEIKIKKKYPALLLIFYILITAYSYEGKRDYTNLTQGIAPYENIAIDLTDLGVVMGQISYTELASKE